MLARSNENFRAPGENRTRKRELLGKHKSQCQPSEAFFENQPLSNQKT